MSDNKLTEITRQKRVSYCKVSKEMLDGINYEFGFDGDDFTNELVTVKSTLINELERYVEDLNIVFSHELPLTWADYMRKAKGLPYKKETVHFNKWFEVEYRRVFRDIEDGEGLSSVAYEK